MLYSTFSIVYLSGAIDRFIAWVDENYYRTSEKALDIKALDGKDILTVFKCVMNGETKPKTLDRNGRKIILEYEFMSDGDVCKQTKSQRSIIFNFPFFCKNILRIYRNCFADNK